MTTFVAEWDLTGRRTAGRDHHTERHASHLVDPVPLPTSIPPASGTVWHRGRIPAKLCRGLLPQLRHRRPRWGAEFMHQVLW